MVTLKVQLQVILESLPTGSVLQIAAAMADSPNAGPAMLPAEITSLLEEFQDVFAPPEGYPSAQHYDHEIPLIAGVAPVQVRP